MVYVSKLNEILKKYRNKIKWMKYIGNIKDEKKNKLKEKWNV